MISPYGGCPNCHIKYCYRCLSTEIENEAERGERGKCKCGYWHNFCLQLITEEDVLEFVKLKDGVPFDERCGCVICNVCSLGKKCEECSGDCAVCLGVVFPAPTAIGEKWRGFIPQSQRDRDMTLKVKRLSL